jgi:riboflavin biosynthesis pyrimidine reductase
VDETPAALPADDDELAECYAPAAAPWLRVNFVTSIDGAVAVEGRSRGLSSPADRRVFGLLRMRCDALLVGAGTLRQEQYGPLRLDERRQRWRAGRGLAEHPVLVVFSRTLDLDPAGRPFTGAPVRPLVFAPASAPAGRRQALGTVADVITAGQDSVDLAAAVTLLHRRGLRHLLSEGGPHLLGGLTAADLVDEVCLTMSPVLAGAGAGRITAGPTSRLRRMRLQQALTGDGALFLRYVREP